MHVKYVFRSFVVSCFALVFSGCVTSDPKPEPVASTSDAPAPAPSKSNLSYGMVNAKVKENVTTQAEILDLFGAPNITTSNADGEEVWVYEVSSSSSQTAGESSTRAAQLSAFFGAGNLGNNTAMGGGGGGGVSAEKRKSNSQTTFSSRTLTVIIKFNKDNTVKSSSTRATSF